MDSAEKVGLILREAKARGDDFEAAWFWAMREISPPRTCGPELRAECDLDRALMHEVKAVWLAAWEGRDVTDAERAEIERRAASRIERLGEVEPLAA